MIKAALWIYLGCMIVMGIIIYFTLRWRQNKPLIHHFTASTVWKAFILNSVAASMVIFIAITTKKTFDNYLNLNGDSNCNTGLLDAQDDQKPPKNSVSATALSTFITLTSTFMTSLLAYTILYVLFGFGGGMIAISNT